VSTQGLWHYPATITNASIATEFAQFAPATGFATTSTAGTYSYSRSIYPSRGLFHELRALGFTHKAGFISIHILQLMKYVSQLIIFPHEAMLTSRSRCDQQHFRPATNGLFYQLGHRLGSNLKLPSTCLDSLGN
jgi:hypothetical protein